MKALFSKFTLIFLFISIVSSNLYAEEKIEVINNSNTTVDVQISGLAGTYEFSGPEYVSVYHSGSGTTTVTLDGSHLVGILDAGIPVSVTVKRSNSSATKINVFSQDYRELQSLDADGTKVLHFTVPYTKSNVVLMALQ